MSKIIKYYTFVGLLVLLQVIQPVSIVCADECADLKEQAKKERSILKRLSLYKSAVSVCPDDPNLLYSYAFSLERMGKYKDALFNYEQVIELDPSHAKAWFNMGDIYRSQEKRYEAIKAYQQGLQISPDNPRVEKRLQELLKDTAEE